MRWGSRLKCMIDCKIIKCPEYLPDHGGFFEGIKKQEERVIQRRTSASLLITGHFGKENRLQPYIFDIHPFFNETGELIGTIAQARHCGFFFTFGLYPGQIPDNIHLNCVFLQILSQASFERCHEKTRQLPQFFLLKSEGH